MGLLLCFAPLWFSVVAAVLVWQAGKAARSPHGWTMAATGMALSFPIWMFGGALLTREVWGLVTWRDDVTETPGAYALFAIGSGMWAVIFAGMFPKTRMWVVPLVCWGAMMTAPVMLVAYGDTWSDAGLKVVTFGMPAWIAIHAVAWFIMLPKAHRRGSVTLCRECESCGYSLVGLAAGAKCPECGEATVTPSGLAK